MPIPLRLLIVTFSLILLASGASLYLDAQAPPQLERAADESGLTITCEVFCSETKLRTANARIRWHTTKPGPQAEGLVAAKQTLQATVFPDGFEKNLYVNVPIAPGTKQQAPVAPAAAEQRPLRAFQFKVLEVEQARTSAEGTAELGVVVEDLEPGMTYAWRIAAEVGGATITSPVVMCQAPVCPADIVREPKPGERP